MSLSAARREAGLVALNDLEATRYACWVEALGTTRTWGAESSKDAAVSYFGKTCVTSLESLRRQLDQATDATWSRWVDQADSLHQSMADVAGYRREWGLKGVLLSTGAQTARDVGTAAQTVAQNAGTGFGLGGFLVGAWLVWKVLR